MRPACCLSTWLRLAGTVRYKHITHAPDCLDVAWFGRIYFDHATQTRDLHVDGALQGIPFTTTGKVHQFVTGERFARVHHQSLENREFTGGQHIDLVALLELAGCQ